MLYSICKTSITPGCPVLQEGFAARHEKSQGVHDELYATLVLLQADTALALISLDLLQGDRAFGDRVAADIARALEIAPEQVLVSYIHTHGSVSARLAGGGDAYTRGLCEVLTKLADQCKASLREGTLSFCRLDSDFCVSRRCPDGRGGVLWRPFRDPSAYDPDLFLLRVLDAQGAPRGLLYSYACHPTSCGPDNLLITADYPGAVRAQLAARFPGLEAVFFQGCGADAKPAMTDGGDRFVSLSPEAMTEGARALTDEIARQLEGGDWREIEPDFRAARVETRLAASPWPPEIWQALAADENEPAYRREAAAQAVRLLGRGELMDALPYFVQCLWLDKKTRFIALECEVVSAIGKSIKAALPGDTITLGYAHSVCCYIPTSATLREGGYEAETFLEAGISGPFADQPERTILKAALAANQACSRA